MANSEHILVLDDDFDIVSLIKISLQKIQLNVFAFTDPFLALDWFSPICECQECLDLNS
jgi:DNA-binding response OmpR family regulator